MPIGARIQSHFQRPDPALVAALAGYSTCDLADAMGRFHMADPAIRPMAGAGRLAGPALTVLTRPDDNLMIHAAIDLAEPGDVLVISAGGGVQTALVGELVAAWAAQRGLAGFVIDGPVRDIEALALPTYARGCSVRAPFKKAAGEVGYPVGLGGVAVMPGDIVVADDNGVVIIPKDDAPDVLQRVQAIAAGDEQSRAAMAAGQFDRSWVKEATRAAGVAEEGDDLG